MPRASKSGYYGRLCNVDKSEGHTDEYREGWSPVQIIIYRISETVSDTRSLTSSLTMSEDPVEKEARNQPPKMKDNTGI